MNKIQEVCNYAQSNSNSGNIAIGEIISDLSLGTWIDILKEHPNQNSQCHFWIFTQKKKKFLMQ